MSLTRRKSGHFFEFQIRNGADPKCVDSAVGDEQNNKPVEPYACHQQGLEIYFTLVAIFFIGQLHYKYILYKY
jgi:hypothetical protein